MFASLVVVIVTPLTIVRMGCLVSSQGHFVSSGSLASLGVPGLLHYHAGLLSYVSVVDVIDSGLGPSDSQGYLGNFWFPSHEEEDHDKKNSHMDDTGCEESYLIVMLVLFLPSF